MPVWTAVAALIAGGTALGIHFSSKKETEELQEEAQKMWGQEFGFEEKKLGVEEEFGKGKLALGKKQLALETEKFKYGAKSEKTNRAIALLSEFGLSDRMLGLWKTHLGKGGGGI